MAPSEPPTSWWRRSLPPQAGPPSTRGTLDPIGPRRGATAWSYLAPSPCPGLDPYYVGGQDRAQSLGPACGRGPLRGLRFAHRCGDWVMRLSLPRVCFSAFSFYREFNHLTKESTMKQRARQGIKGSKERTHSAARSTVLSQSLIPHSPINTRNKVLAVV